MNLDDNDEIESVKLADFGLSRRTSEKLMAGADTRGTPQYMAPEMLTKETKFDKKIDSWSLGILLFEILFGVTLFDSDSQKRIVKKIKKFEELDFTAPLLNDMSIEV